MSSEPAAAAAAADSARWGRAPRDPPAAPRARLLPAVLARGWQRSALYALLVLLMLIVFVNLGLTLWIIASLRLSFNSIGPLHIVPGGVALEGAALVQGRLVAAAVAARAGRPLALRSHRNFSVRVDDPDGSYAGLTIQREQVTCSGREFSVTDGGGRGVFHAARGEVRVRAARLAADAGLAVRGAVQAPLVRAPPASDLVLESQTRSLDVRAPQSIHLESRTGDVTVTSHRNIKFESVVGALKIEAQNIYVPNLRQAAALPHGEAARRRGARAAKVYQLCACAGGRVFLAAPDAVCAARAEDDDLCR